MLSIGHECSACGTYLDNRTEEGAHQCLREGARRYSVFYAAPVEGGDPEYEFRVLVTAGSTAAVLTHLCSAVDPENYEVTEWIGRAGLGTAYEGERTWGDLWLEENA